MLSRKNFWGLLVLGLVGSLLLMATAVLILFLTSPLKKIMDAGLKTGYAFASQIGTMDRLPPLLDTYGSLTDDGCYTYRLQGQMELADFGNVLLDMTGNRKQDTTEQDGNICLEVLDEGSLVLPYYTDNQSFYVDFSEVFQDTSLILTTEDFVSCANKLLGQELLASGWKPFSDSRNSFDMAALSHKIDACMDALLPYVLSLRPRQIDSYAIGPHHWTEYRLEAGKEEQRALLDALYDCIEEAVMLYEAEESLQELTHYLGQCLDTDEDLVIAMDERGYLLSVTIATQNAQVRCRLEGDGNPWEKVVICCMEDHNTLFSGCIQMLEGALSLDARLPQHGLRLTLTYENTAQSFTANMDAPGIRTTASGSVVGKDGALTLQVRADYMDQQINLICSLMEPSAAPAAIETGYAVDPHNLTVGDGLHLVQSYQGDNGNWILRKLLQILLPSIWEKLLS